MTSWGGTARRVHRTLVRGLVVAAVAALAAAAAALAHPQPFNGTYRGTPKGTGAHNGGEGCFIEKPTVFGKRVKPASGNGSICQNQIIAPSLGPIRGARKGCNAKPAVLNSGGFPIRKGGFHYDGRAPIGRHGRSLRVDFRGKWVTRFKVRGTTSISGGGCKSTVGWTMRTSSRPPH